MDLQTAIERAKSALEQRIKAEEAMLENYRSVAVRDSLRLDAQALQALREWKPEENAEKYERLSKAYNELIMAVGRKFPGEIRHDTALRYINEAESKECCGPSRDPDSAPTGEGREE